jgi:uncharacterized membrane protein
MGKHTSRHIDQHRRREQFLKQSAAARRHFSWNWVLILGGLGFLAAVLYVSASIPTPDADASNVQPAETLPTGQEVRLATTSFTDGRARFYRYTTAAGREIRFFVIRSSDGVIRAAFDACDVCFWSRRGYHQSRDTMICNNCGRAFHSVDVNVVTGGCNPGPLERTIASDHVVITPAAIERGASYF